MSSADKVALRTLSQGRTKALETSRSTGLTETGRWVRVIEIDWTGGETLIVEVEIVD